MTTAFLSTLSIGDITQAIFDSLSERAKGMTQPVAAIPGRNALPIADFTKRFSMLPIDGSEGVLIGMTSSQQQEWDYLHIRANDRQELIIEADEDMAGVAPVVLPSEADVPILLSAIVDQFIALGTFTRQDWQDAVSQN